MVKPMKDRLVIDLHCDTLTECRERRIGLDSAEMPHFSIGRLPEGLRLCQCMAVFMPDELRGKQAKQYFEDVYQLYLSELETHKDRITPVTAKTGIAGALERTRIAAMLTVEGGSALAGDIANLDVLHEKGVRMMTLTWNAENEIAGGVATDIGFSRFGREVIERMEALGIVVDVSHLSDRAFWELCEFAQKPFAASHSNSRTICGHRRNLTDEMFGEFVKRGGIVGLNYSCHFIKDGGKSDTIEDFLAHVHHFLALGGEDVLALGSDYDGTDIPHYLEGLDKLNNLTEALDRSGIPADVVDKILFGNANRYFSGIIGGSI